ncbi:MAG: hypothetical protein AAF487_11335 [Bacteroidota bacterium]
MKTLDQCIYRAARKEDIPALAPLIASCLKGPNGKSNLGVMFDLSEEEVVHMIEAILVQDIPNHEFHFGNYMVCEREGTVISICSGWNENVDSLSSENIKSSLIASYLGFDKWKESLPMIRKFAELNIPRQSGHLYLENAGTKKEYRQLNVAYTLVYELIKKRLSEHPSLKTIHSHVFLSNEIMYNMFLRFQYKVLQQNLLPSGSELNHTFPVKGVALVSIGIREYIDLYEKNMGIMKGDEQVSKAKR